MDNKKNLISYHLCKIYSHPSIGRPKYNVVIPSTNNQSEVYMGEDINSNKRGMFKLRYPIKHGII